MFGIIKNEKKCNGDQTVWVNKPLRICSVDLRGWSAVTIGYSGQD